MRMVYGKKKLFHYFRVWHMFSKYYLVYTWDHLRICPVNGDGGDERLIIQYIYIYIQIISELFKLQ